MEKSTTLPIRIRILKRILNFSSYFLFFSLCVSHSLNCLASAIYSFIYMYLLFLFLEYSNSLPLNTAFLSSHETQQCPGTPKKKTIWSFPYVHIKSNQWFRYNNKNNERKKKKISRICYLCACSLRSCGTGVFVPWNRQISDRINFHRVQKYHRRPKSELVRLLLFFTSALSFGLAIVASTQFS